MMFLLVTGQLVDMDWAACILVKSQFGQLLDAAGNSSYGIVISDIVSNHSVICILFFVTYIYNILLLCLQWLQLIMLMMMLKNINRQSVVFHCFQHTHSRGYKL